MQGCTVWGTYKKGIFYISGILQLLSVIECNGALLLEILLPAFPPFSKRLLIIGLALGFSGLN